jgi:hypothetical protein
MEPFITKAGKHHLRFSINSQSIMPDKILNNITKKWIRICIKNDISSIPQAEYIKVHTCNTTIKKDGFIEYFGNARKVVQLPITLERMIPANSILGSQAVHLSRNLSINRTNNVFTKGQFCSLGFVGYLPESLDISFPLRLKLSYLTLSTSSGNVEFILNMSCSTRGSPLCISSNTAPPNSSKYKMIQRLVNIPENSNNKDLRCNICIDIHEVNVNPENKNPHMIWLSLERNSDPSNTNDTFDGDIIMIQITVFGVMWKNGAHLLAY